METSILTTNTQYEELLFFINDTLQYVGGYVYFTFVFPREERRLFEYLHKLLLKVEAKAKRNSAAATKRLHLVGVL